MSADRHVRGDIKRREEARAIYEAARDAGKMAALLDQERPNIFTQHVANIRAGDKVRIVISYVERLKYEDGNYEWVFPMVVGPRYIPGTPVGRAGGGWAYDTDRVPDASKITPVVAKPGTRAGHDISLSVNIDAGVPIQSLNSTTHPGIHRTAGRATRQRAAEGPGRNSQQGFRAPIRRIRRQDRGRDSDASREPGGFFTLILQPPDKTNVEDITPKELVFVLDTSGSMSGFPIEKAKETMKLALDGLNPRDTFQPDHFRRRYAHPFPAARACHARRTFERRRIFFRRASGAGGTEMMKAITAALAPSDSSKAVRVVVLHDRWLCR